MAVLASMVAGAMVFSSFAAPKHCSNNECVQLTINNRPIWEGRAYDRNNNSWLSLKVYPDGCGSYYAVIQASGAFSCKVGDEVWVTGNPDYDPDRRDSSYYTKKYRISYRDKYFYFNM